jgi:hypothetical protein
MLQGEGTPRKLATATQPQFPRIEHVELNGAVQIEETTIQLAEDWETQLPGY